MIQKSTNIKNINKIMESESMLRNIWELDCYIYYICIYKRLLNVLHFYIVFKLY